MATCWRAPVSDEPALSMSIERRGFTTAHVYPDTGERLCVGLRLEKLKHTPTGTELFTQHERQPLTDKGRADAQQVSRSSRGLASH